MNCVNIKIVKAILKNLVFEDDEVLYVFFRENVSVSISERINQAVLQYCAFSRYQPFLLTKENKRF